jgi:hypothetical protein
MFRKLIPLTFLSLIVIQLVGFNVYFFNEKAKIKKQIKTYIKEGVPKNQMNTFLFSKNQFKQINWIKANKEFKIGENYYDIVWSKTNKNNEIILFCVNDKQETKLFQHLNTFLDKNLGKNNQTNSLAFVFQILNSPFVISDLNLPFYLIDFNEKKINYTFYTNSLSEGNYFIFLPPPNFC